MSIKPDRIPQFGDAVTRCFGFLGHNPESKDFPKLSVLLRPIKRKTLMENSIVIFLHLLP